MRWKLILFFFLLLCPQFASARRIISTENRNFALIEHYLGRALTREERQGLKEELIILDSLFEKNGITKSKFILKKLIDFSWSEIPQLIRNLQVFEEFIYHLPSKRSIPLDNVITYILNDLAQVRPQNPEQVREALNAVKELAIILDRFSMDIKTLRELSYWASLFSKIKTYNLEEYIKNLICFNNVITAFQGELEDKFGQRILEKLISTDSNLKPAIFPIIKDYISIATTNRHLFSTPAEFRNYLKCYLLAVLIFINERRLNYEEMSDEIKSVYPTIIENIKDIPISTELEFIHTFTHTVYITSKLMLAGVIDINTVLKRLIEVIKIYSSGDSIVYGRISHSLQDFIAGVSDFILNKDHSIINLVNIALDVSKVDAQEFLKNIGAIKHFLEVVQKTYGYEFQKIEKQLDKLEEIRDKALKTDNPASNFRRYILAWGREIEKWGGILE